MAALMEGVHVLDLSEGYEGYTGMMLAEFGADVVKVEPPEGDHLRLLGPPFIAGESAAFMGVNRAKKSVVLDWKQSAEARAILDRMIASADVVLTTCYVDDAEALGLSYEALRALNPSVVHCSITPMGDSGPEMQYRASDLEIQGMFGHWRYLGEPKFHRTAEAPLRLGVPVAALNSAVFAFQGVTAALIHRHRTGQGQKVMISEAASLIAMKNIQFAAESEPDEYEGHNVGHLRPQFRGTATKDRQIYWGASAEVADIAKLVEAVGLGELLQQPEYQTDALRKMMSGEGDLKWRIELRFMEMPAEQAMAIIREHNGAAVYYNTFEGVSKDAQAVAMGMTAEFEHPVAGTIGTTGMPWFFSNDTLRPGAPPVLGQHTLEVLRGLGLPDAELARLRQAGVVRQADGF